MHEHILYLAVNLSKQGKQLFRSFVTDNKTYLCFSWVLAYHVHVILQGIAIEKMLKKISTAAFVFYCYQALKFS
jgi:hypothetical protein